MNSDASLIRLITAAALLSLAVPTASAQRGARVDRIPGSPAPREEAPSANAADAAADLLDALETADAGIETFTATLDYSKFYAIQSDEQRRVGQLYYRTDRSAPDAGANAGGEPAAPRRQFAVTFYELIVGDRREQIDQHYAFDGQWVVEKTAEDRQFTKRQVVPPGEQFDPLKIGEGPFPVPIGQKKDDILERFDAEIVATAEGLTDTSLADFAKAKGLIQLRLVPKPTSPQAGDFKSIQIWYEPEGRMLPRIAKTVTPVGDEALVVLLNPEINKPIESGLFSTDIPPADEEWNVHVSEFRQPATD